MWWLRWASLYSLLQWSQGAPTEQRPLLLEEDRTRTAATPESGARKLKGRFLHITDLHPDPYYKIHSSTEEEYACHRGDGPAGVLGAETTDCDSPFTLINATFKWIEENLKDEIDFVLWTGDSARHDNDEEWPRSDAQVIDLNRMVVGKFEEVFGKSENINDTDPTNDFIIPIIPTWGNNDILPHNILLPGPNKWTHVYLDIWRAFIPEEQRHSFERGGWFLVEVIPNRLAVVSLNTLYFFDNNSAVDGCAGEFEPGYEHFQWLRIQLEFLRQRGMKAILMGHIPPARTESKTSWDETCWQKYTLWLHQYRDVIVGSVYGHMNIDHFMLQDSKQVKSKHLLPQHIPSRTTLAEEMTAQAKEDYLLEIRTEWSALPDALISKQVSVGSEDRVNMKEGKKRKKGKKDKKGKKGKKGRKGKEDKKTKKFLKEIGGEWAERYSLSLVGPSVVPNYFPTLRVIEYNISGLDSQQAVQEAELHVQEAGLHAQDSEHDMEMEALKKTPHGPAKTAPPGPAYSPQTFTFLGYTQYFANLTEINNDFNSESVESARWKGGKHVGKRPKESVEPRPFHYDVEYDTRYDKVFSMKDLTVRSYLELAARIGRFKPEKKDRMEEDFEGDIGASEQSWPERVPEELNTQSSEYKAWHSSTTSKKKPHHHESRKAINRIWFEFVRRAFVGTMEDADLHQHYGQPIDDGD